MKIDDIKDINILKGLNIDIKPGEFVAIIGKVGCGKSSFMNSLMWMLTQTEG